MRRLIQKRALPAVGLQPQLLRTAAYQQPHQDAAQKDGGALPQKGGPYPPELHQTGEQYGGEDGGHSAARRGQPQGQPLPVLKPPANGQGDGDHPGPAVAHPREGSGGAVHGKAVRKGEAQAGRPHQEHPQGHHRAQSPFCTQLIDAQQGGQDEQAAGGGNPGALGVGKAVETDNLRLIDGEDVDPQPHNGKEGQRPAQADQPGAVGTI